jgi:D-alanine-D-alanine ligase
MEKKLNILLLKGGTSSEREVSLISGTEVAKALRSAGHTVQEYDIQKPEVTEAMRKADIVYPVLHGGFGEDGTLQKVMEEAGLKFVGCPSQACIDAMDKVVSKQIMDREGIRNAKYFVAESSDVPFPEEFGLPLIVKPPCEGSTFGLTLVESRDQWKGALELALKHDKVALVEEYISGVEATVGIIDGKPVPVIEIRYPGKLYDYDAKYTHANGETQYICPPTGISEKAQKEAQDLALKFYHAVGARDMIRVDMIIDSEDRVWILEGNTLPGCTPSSLLPKAAKIAGISFPEMCSSLAYAAYNR